MAVLKPLGNWKHFTEHVQNLSVSDGGNFLSSESSVICSGPAELGSASLEQALIPIGLVQNAQVSQSKQIQQLFEVGSRKPYFVPGRTMVQSAISRVLFDGPSLMKVLYRHGVDGDTVTGTAATLSNNYDTTDNIPPGAPYPSEATGTSASTETGKFFTNLASDFFNRPLGLAFIFKDMQGDQIGGFYLENCYIQTHQLSLAAQQTILMENVGLRAATLRPISFGSASEFDTVAEV